MNRCDGKSRGERELRTPSGDHPCSRKSRGEGELCKSSGDDRCKHGVFSFRELSSSCLTELTNDVVPFWLKYGVDKIYGGFLCGLSHDGKVVDDSKYTWYQGRGAWIFAKLYGFQNKKEYLDIAKKALDFVEKHCRQEDDATFFTSVSRDGSTLRGRSVEDTVGYASMFYAEGLQQVALHERDDAKRKNMLDTVTAVSRTFLTRCENEHRNAPESYLICTPSKPYMRGTRTLGHQMIPLRLATQVLKNFAGDSALSDTNRRYFEDVATKMVHNIVVKFWDEDVRLSREELSYTFSKLNDPTLFYLGHAIEAYWFVMSEACRQTPYNDALVELACDRIRRHFECAYDHVFGGCVRGITLTRGGRNGGVEPLYNDKQMMDKVAWVQQEALVALLMVRERSKRSSMVAWAKEQFTILYVWVRSKFPLKNYGEYSLWMCGADRRATFQENYSHGNAGLKSRKENYHHPRFLMRVVEEYERSCRLGKAERRHAGTCGRNEEKPPPPSKEPPTAGGAG